MAEPGQNGRSNVLNQPVPLHVAIAWTFGVAGTMGGVIAMLAWAVVMNRNVELEKRIVGLESGMSTPMARTTKLRFEQIDRELARLEREVDKLNDREP